jgi:ParB family chromosome partitioning protein
MASTTNAGKELMKAGFATYLSETVKLGSITPPALVERNIIDKDGIQELAENIKQVGLINPLTVKKVKDKYEIVAGHRRYLALKLLGIKSVQVKVIAEEKGNSEVIKLSENLMREDLNDYEEAVMLLALKSLTKKDDKIIGRMIGKSESYVRQKCGIMKYHNKLVEALKSGAINFSVARELARLKNESILLEYLRHAINGGATPAIVEAWVDDVIAQEKAEKGMKVGKKGDKMQVQVVGGRFVCSVCEGSTDLSKSRLYRVCDDCAKKMEIGG